MRSRDILSKAVLCWTILCLKEQDGIQDRKEELNSCLFSRRQTSLAVIPRENISRVESNLNYSAVSC